MNESQISVRYAKALFQSAFEQQLLDNVYKDMEVLTNTCKLEDFQYMLEVPTLQPSQKIKLAGDIFEKYFSKISLSMI
ncbi:MAG: F0F1 ATP synthase subunit delta, partial [Bacteroidales bacterium]|nr:F0F1 ATP synthase subunit delta [Bacteroidales bacterium]